MLEKLGANMASYLADRTVQIIILILVAAVMMLRGLGDPSIGFPDADRILMDGVFIADTIRDFPLTNPWEYAQAYFVQYPALSIGYRPPFFPFVEGLFNLIFGVNTWSSRLALFAFVIAGIVFWYRFAADLAGRSVAFFSTLLWVTTPFLAQWGWYTMAELAVLSMALIAVYYIQRWLTTEQAKYSLYAAIFIGLAAWTKQTAAFLVLIVLANILMNKQIGWAVRQKMHWYAMGLLVVIIAPLAAMTLYFGDMNIYQSVGEMTPDRAPRWSFANWGIHLNTLVYQHLSIGGLVLVAAGIIVAGYSRLKWVVTPVIAILAVYVFFSLMVGKNTRYPIFWIPFWCLVAAAPLYVWPLREWQGKLYAGAIGVVVLLQAQALYEKQPFYATGYDEAAQFAVEQSHGPSIFIDAFNNGYFTYFVRQADTEREQLVFRGDKLLSSSAIAGEHWLEVHLSSKQEIVELFDQLGVSIIVLESVNYMGLPVHGMLRELVKEPEFELLRTIEIDGNRMMSTAPGRPLFKDQQLLVYRYLNATGEVSGEVKLRLPVVGKDISKDMSLRQ